MSEPEIRPFRDEDRAAITDFQNARRPPHLRATVAEWERGDALRLPEEVQLRLCIGEPAVAYLGVVDRGTSAWRKPGTASFSLGVAQAHWRQGLGTALYEQAEMFARERGLTRITTYIRLFTPDEPAVRFLESRGFTEVDRDVPLKLDLTTFDSSAFPRPELPGIRLLSMAEAGDTEADRRKFYALGCALEPDIPTNEGHPKFPSFEQFAKDFDLPEYDPNTLILAETAAGDWVGLSQFGFQEHTNVGFTYLTGVLPDHRGKGLALALKLRAMDAAKARGCPLLTTENHQDNAPMRAINKKLGFVPDAPGISYGKDI